MGPLLEAIQDPQDLKKLDKPQMEQLAQEIRAFLIESVAVTGGHLAPNLGVVELTLALHSCFDSPRDKIIWDVGHQSYVHKILTGRRDAMASLRQHKGMAGFPKRYESPHDPIETGHSSTSISAALGMALARDLKGEKNHVVAVIGDGALTGGMAFEALNHAGDAKSDLIVVLNDNEMSIANNVGGMASYLSRMRSDPRYYKRKKDFEELVDKIPSIGPQVRKTMERIKDSFKYLLVPGMLFEELGFTYMGPIDGHNLQKLREVLQNAKKLGGPVLVHVLTKKGKGYGPAETNPDTFHGVGPYDVETGEVKKSPGPPTYTKVFSDALVRLGAERENLLAVTAAMPDGTGLTAFSRTFPARFFDVGIAEQHAVTMASGLALEGFRPVVAIYSTFLQRAYDQIFHDVCLQKAPVIFAIDRAGLVGEDGVTHQGVFDMAYLRHIPGMVVMAPKDEAELQHMLYTAAEYEEGPIAMRYPRGAGIGVPLPEEFQKLPIGKGEVVREGRDLAILAVGPHVYTALEAAKALEREGISAAVINPRFIKPLDGALIGAYAKKTGRILTVEEGCLAGGFGSAVLEFLDEAGIEAEVERLGIPDAFVEHGAVSLLREELGLTVEGIAEGARRLMAVTSFQGKLKIPSGQENK